jgi:hypothetical protein
MELGSFPTAGLVVSTKAGPLPEEANVAVASTELLVVVSRNEIVPVGISTLFDFVKPYADAVNV